MQCNKRTYVDATETLCALTMTGHNQINRYSKKEEINTSTPLLSESEILWTLDFTQLSATGFFLLQDLTQDITGLHWMCFISIHWQEKKSPDALGSSLKFTKPRGEATVPSTAANTALLSESFWVPGMRGCHQPLNWLALHIHRLLGLWDTAGWTTEAASVLSLVTIPCVCVCVL